MKEQNYKNHVKYYPAHHFIFYPAVLALLIFAIIEFFKGSDLKWVWFSISCLTLLVAWSSFMMRQHYGLIAQNRIIRLEMRLRYYQLTQRRIEPLEEKLGFGRLAALRFASDEELPALVDKALAENLSSSDIKREIRSWQADHMRV